MDDRIALIAKAKLIVAQHGAGQANALFSQPGTDIVDLVGYGHLMNFTHNAFSYVFQASVLDHRHHSIICESSAGSSQSPKQMDIAVDPNELDIVLTQIAG